MTANAFELDAEIRSDQGKGASRRLRRTQDKIPAILYGGGKAPVALALDHKKVLHALQNQAFYSHILTLNIAGERQQAVLKDLQRHHFKKAIFHMDFLRVNATDQITMRVPLHFLGESLAAGVKAGGIISHRQIDVEIRCIASNLPEYIEVDVSQLELNQTLHLSDLKLPKGVELVALTHGSEHDYAVVSIHLPRSSTEPETTTAPTKETEVLPKGKEANPNTASSTASATKEKEKGKGK